MDDGHLIEDLPISIRQPLLSVLTECVETNEV